ncbi:hypothetical protein NMP99_02945 [Glutamicibacter mishrai]|uniref:hypothetical protein n=1 Tax=Glutamicibacter mishrai TaxID=1775880 RepID=UPI0020CBEA28|nr:hypothetical protein [Glutamicibacter mishrai]UTT40232.1 hypothetical protein NMP99_02655 [Glutamicibacter mishrai]UTT40283.1 hypothetical protein NMP99_02945 [Glutamicibacter mishrai]
MTQELDAQRLAADLQTAVDANRRLITSLARCETALARVRTLFVGETVDRGDAVEDLNQTIRNTIDRALEGERE